MHDRRRFVFKICHCVIFLVSGCLFGFATSFANICKIHCHIKPLQSSLQSDRITKKSKAVKRLARYKINKLQQNVAETTKDPETNRITTEFVIDLATTLIFSLLGAVAPFTDSSQSDAIRVAISGVISNATSTMIPSNSTSIQPNDNREQPPQEVTASEKINDFIIRNVFLPIVIHQLVRVMVTSTLIESNSFLREFEEKFGIFGIIDRFL